MMRPIHPNETARLACLRSLDILDSAPEPKFDDVALIATKVAECRFSIVTLMDHYRQWFKANVGLPMSEIPFETTLCKYAIASGEPLIVPDARLDPRFADHPFVTGEFGLRFYAGFPILVDGFPVGTVCVGETDPRTLSPGAHTALLALARQTASLLESRRDERQARLAEGRFAAFMDNTPSLAFLKDGEGRMQYVNAQFERVFGFGPGELLGKRDGDWLPARAAETTTDRDQRVLESGEPSESLETIAAPDGQVREWAVQKFPVEMGHERWIGGTAVDVTELHQARRAAQAERDFSEAVLGNGGALICVVDRDGRFVRFNAECERVTGWSANEVRGRAFWETVTPEDDGRSTQLWFIGLGPDDFPLCYERAWRTKADERRLIDWRSTALVDASGRVEFVVSTGIDVTIRRSQEKLLWRQRRELREANVRLERLATTDELTRVANRFAFRERLADELARAERSGEPLSVVLLDVDRFKGFNDEFGHAAGDAALALVANVLVETSRTPDLVARYGGEEFVVLLPGAGREDALLIAERLRGAVEDAPSPYRGVTASFGVATLGLGATTTSLLVQADRAMYASKTAGRNRVTHHEDTSMPSAA